jgi:hypothetical protein
LLTGIGVGRKLDRITEFLSPRPRGMDCQPLGSNAEPADELGTGVEGDAKLISADIGHGMGWAALISKS